MEGLTRNVRLSRRLNRLLGGADEMLCTRWYREERRVLVLVVDVVFVVVRLRVHRHCREMHEWESGLGEK